MCLLAQRPLSFAFHYFICKHTQTELCISVAGLSSTHYYLTILSLCCDPVCLIAHGLLPVTAVVVDQLTCCKSADDWLSVTRSLEAKLQNTSAIRRCEQLSAVYCQAFQVIQWTLLYQTVTMYGTYCG